MNTPNNRTCYYAGATGMIGRGAVKALADSGMNVVMATHDPAGAEEVIELTKDCPGRVIALSNKLTYTETAEYILQEFGSLDVVISKTGGMDPLIPLEKVTEDQLAAKFRHQVIGPFTMVQAFLPYLCKSENARIILHSSLGAISGYPNESIPDSIGRSGVIGLTKVLAQQLLKDHITVNCIAFSGMINDHEPREGGYDTRLHVRDIPLSRLAESGEYGALVRYLASEESGFMTGQILELTGGMHI